MASVVARTAAAVVLLALAAAAVDVSTLETVFNYQVQSDTTLQAAAAAVLDTSSFRSQLSGAFGFADRTNGNAMMLDNIVRVNTLSETLVVAAALRLVAASVLPSIDSTIPTTYLPQQVSLINPAHATTPITLRMLMTHTSTLSDASFETARRTSPTAVVDLRSFVTSYMVTSSGGVNTLSTSIFTAGATPGSTAAYNYARINTAVLTFIIEMAVIANPGQITGTTYTALAYVREKILSPLGMSDTVTMTTTGGFPTLSYPTLGDAYSERVVEDRSSAGTTLTSRTLHPAYFSDYMTFSSPLDLARLVQSLFLSTSTSTSSNLAAIGNVMKSKTVVNGGVSAMTATGLGIMYFNGATMCASALATGAITKCPLTAAHNVWGFVSSGQFSLVGYYCTDAVSTTNPTCVTTVHTYNDAGSAGTKPVELSQAMAAAALQLAIGDTSQVSQTTVSSSSRSDLYGVWVFFGVLGVLIFVFLASYATEAIIQPAPVTNGVPVPQSMMPQQVARVPTDNYMNSN
eukprot:CAMPEP_0174835638 /NCGR_PEP_ID=MMETSP1114-20130205/5506_1 /TAXON_ID=312471 /ORGANISM="Neobodo designis, Strain CCAP 1951/1" /LENGTH=516 /DNA_ID=CAMNT_0016069591 /DNA_START=56 /DNA_END=1606 /DNA_ORIENTATION=-